MMADGNLRSTSQHAWSSASGTGPWRAGRGDEEWGQWSSGTGPGGRKIPCQRCSNTLGRKLGLSLGKPAADPVRPQLGVVELAGDDMTVGSADADLTWGINGG